MFSGWIKLHRELLNKPIWKLSNPKQKTILITLLMMASHKIVEWEWSYQKFKIEPGQFVTSLESIKEIAGKEISIRNIRTSLVRFEKLGFLANKSTKQGRLISIINWESYQGNGNETDKETDKGVTKHRQRGDNYQECKECKNEKNIYFEQFWKAYPKKKNKGHAEIAFDKIKCDKEKIKIIISKIDELKKSNDWKKDNGQFIPYPSTWLNARGWEDEIESLEKEKNLFPF
jgi:hypothetical protein